MRVAIRVDAGPLIGGGHAMRCLTLADALAERGTEVIFLTAAMPEPLATRIEASGHKLERIAAPAGLEREGVNRHEPALDEAEQQADARATGASAGAVDWVVVDHYLLDARWHAAARSFAQRLLVIDDLANRAYDCDLLVDQTFGRTPADYAGRTHEAAKILTGATYALLRPEFARERRAALDRRREPGPVRRVLVSMGTTDIGGSTSAIVEDVLAAASGVDVDVVLGRQAPSLEHVRRLAGDGRRVELHVDVPEMARLMVSADLAVGAAGTTTWERCCLGLPSVVLMLAENQRPSAVALSAAGAALVMEHADEVGPAVHQLVGELDGLEQMSAAAFAIVDGRGADRVAASIFGNEESHTGEIELRPATPQDSELLWLWRNDPLTREQSRNTEAISWKSHARWLTPALADVGRQIMIATRNGKPIGTVGFHTLEGGSEVSITVAPDQRRGGTGRAILSAGCAQRVEDVYAAVRTGNEASRRLFESCGFRPVESNEAGFVRYLRPGEDGRRKQA